MPVTAQHFLSYRQTGIAGARSVDWIARVPYPLLMVRDAHDPVINYFEPGQLEAAGHRAERAGAVRPRRSALGLAAA